MRFAAGFLSALLLLALAGALVVWTGAYNFAATDAHAGAVRSTIDAALENSVAGRADELVAPASFSRDDLRHGAREFIEYCVHCHGAPGVEPAEWATGMSPNPPELSRAAAEWTTEQTFWIVKHGIKMSGMPPFGDTESDQTIWQIAAFVKQLPEISPAEYARLQAELGGAHQHGGSGGE